MKSESITGIGIILFCIILAAAVVVNNQNTKQHVLNWAEQQGYQVETIQESHDGPFLNNSPEHKMFRARVKGENGSKWMWFRVDQSRQIEILQHP